MLNILPKLDVNLCFTLLQGYMDLHREESKAYGTMAFGQSTDLSSTAAARLTRLCFETLALLELVAVQGCLRKSAYPGSGSC